MKPESKLNQICALLRREFKPSRLFLFGSQSTGKSNADSDYDFVMVVPSYKGDRMMTWQRCRDLIQKECGVLADVFTYSEREFQKSAKEFSSIPETAVNTGTEINLGAP